MFRTYLKSAWRNAWKNRTTSFINIAGLSVGMTAAVFILLWVQNETSFDNYKDKKNIYRLTTRIPGWVWETTPLLLADAVKKEIPGVTQSTKLYAGDWPIFDINGSLFYQRNCAYVDENWFGFFPTNFVEGSAAAFNKHPFSIILSQSEAKKYFGNQQATGKSIRINGTSYAVTGVVEDAAANSSFQYKAFIPVAARLSNQQTRQNDEQWNNANYISFIKIGNMENPALIAKKITELVVKNRDAEAAPIGLTSLSDMHFETEIENSAFVHGNRNTMYIFSVLAFLLLLIACINYVNLTTAKASLRAKEVSIRKITGANRGGLFMQFITESVLLSLLALICTIVLVQVCLPAFNELTGKNFTVSPGSTKLWLVLAITLLASLLLNSIYPAFLLSSFKPLNVFRGVTVLKLKDKAFRKSLVVLQFTVSVILISGTIIIYRQLQFIQKDNPGYNRSQVISFAIPPGINQQQRASLVPAMKQELLSQTSIDKVGTSNQPIVNLGSSCSECADWIGHDTSYKPRIAQLSADADFLKTMQLTMLEGEWFRTDNGADKKKFILNETAVKDFNLKAPLVGQYFVFKGDTGQIAGVVKDFAFKSLHEKTGPLIVWNEPSWRNHFAVRTTAGKTTQAISAIEKIWKKYVPESPIEYSFLDDTFNSLYKQDQLASKLILIFSIIAIVISASGLFSLAAFEAEQRTKEIGIRKVLGASVTGIAALLSKDFVKLVCIAVLIASPVAWWASNQWMQNFAYHIDVHWWMFALAGLLALLVALLTTSYQAFKAAVANPVRSLRTE